MRRIEWASMALFSGVAAMAAAIPAVFAFRMSGHHLATGLRALSLLLFG